MTSTIRGFFHGWCTGTSEDDRKQADLIRRYLERDVPARASADDMVRGLAVGTDAVRIGKPR
jgi:hypothetical protein